MAKRVTLTIDNNVATVCLNRSDKLNALDPKMLHGIAEIAREIKNENGIRCVIIHGAGHAFCAGLDFSTFSQIMTMVKEAGGLMNRTHGDANLFQHVALTWQELPMPVIAAVHGHVLGGGMQIMLGADIRIAAADTQFSIMEGKWGLIPDMGGMALMRRLVREDIFRHLTYTAEVFGAEQAASWGFVTEISDDPLQRANELANKISTRSPDAVRAAKSLITKTTDLTTSGVLLAESKAQTDLIGTPNQIEAVMAGLEKRKPKYN